MIAERKGNVIVVAGNNLKKTNYIKTSVEAGFNVLSDKPMAIDRESFLMLKEAFELADKNKVLLYDIMTERHEITSQLQREIALLPEIFGVLEKEHLKTLLLLKKVYITFLNMWQVRFCGVRHGISM
jgi:hypothetical protein